MLCGLVGILEQFARSSGARTNRTRAKARRPRCRATAAAQIRSQSGVGCSGCRRRRPRRRPRAPGALFLGIDLSTQSCTAVVVDARRRRAPPQRQLRRALSGIRHGERLPRRGRRHGDVAGGQVARRPRLRARRAARIAAAAGRRHFLQRPAARRRVLVRRRDTITQRPSEGEDENI